MSSQLDKHSSGLPNTSQLTADLSLLLVTLIWGLTFVTVKNAIAELAPFSFNFFRFLLATVVMLLISWPRRNYYNFQVLQKGILIGFFLFAGYSFQTVGLQYTTASNAGFITGLAVVLVPLLLAISARKLPGVFVLLGVGFAATGLALLSLGNQVNLNFGDVLILICALSFALHIIAVGKFTIKFDTFALVTVQIGTVAVLSGLAALATEPAPAPFSTDVWLALLITAIPATCLAFLIQNYMQKFTSPIRTAIIFSMEPVFAALFAVLLLQEVLTTRAWWGGMMVVAGMILSEVKLKQGLDSEENYPHV